MIFASFALAYHRVLVQNVRDLPQTKLDSEINAPFLLNEHSDPHFLFHNFNKNNILSNWETLAAIYGYFFGKWNKGQQILQRETWQVQQRLSKFCFR